jgi:hypothetical protein
MVRRTSLHLLGVGGILAALSTYLTIEVISRGSSAPITLPASVGEVLAELPGPGSDAPAASRIRVTIDLRLRAVLEAPAEGEPRLRLVGVEGGGERELDGMRAAFAAGPAAAESSTRRFSGRQLARFETLHGFTLYRVVQVPDPPPATIDEVRWVDPVAVSGRVWQEDGSPLAGATIWCSGQEERSDGEGRFRFPSASGGPGVPIAVEAPGWASQMRILDLESDAELEFRLQRAARLRVQFASQATSSNVAQVFVLPGGERDSQSLQWPFFLQAVRGGAALGADGSATIDGLPRDVALRVLVVDPLAPCPEAARVQLRGELTQVTVQGLTVPSLRGRVLDEAGAPLAGAWVTAQPSPASIHEFQDDGWLLPPAAFLAGTAQARSAADGSFAVGRLHGRSGCTVRAASAGRAAATIEVKDRRADLTHDFVLPAAAPAAPAGLPALRFHLPRGECSVRVQRDGAPLTGWTAWGPDAPFVVPLRVPVLADVTVTVDTGDGAPRTLTRRSLSVLGPVDVDAGGTGPVSR